MNSPVLNTKSFRISNAPGAFKAYVSEHEKEYFYANVLHFDWKQTFCTADDNRGRVEPRLQVFYGASEREAFEKMKAWVDQKWPGQHEFVEEV